jgi:hypothetical protein
MKISPILWCIIYYLRLIQSEKYIFKYFKMLRGRRRLGTPIETILTESEVMCGLRCMNNEWCRAINLINNGELQHCELFSEDDVGSGQVIKDELSVYYYALDNEGDKIF